MYYITEADWHFGAAVKSPQWLEPFRFKTEDESGAPRLVQLDFDCPLIVTVGTAYLGLEKFVFACDVRYFDYASADGFRQSGFDPAVAATGLAWSSIMAVSAGV